jgi:hypothetical protein
MRTIASGIDVKNPTATEVDTYQLKVLKPQTVAGRLAGVFPQARVLVAPNRTIIIMASPADMAQIKAIVTAIDTAPPTPSPKPRYPADGVGCIRASSNKYEKPGTGFIKAAVTGFWLPFR